MQHDTPKKLHYTHLNWFSALSYVIIAILAFIYWWADPEGSIMVMYIVSLPWNVIFFGFLYPFIPEATSMTTLSQSIIILCIILNSCLLLWLFAEMSGCGPSEF